MKYKKVLLSDIKKYIYMKLDDPETSPTSICRAYEGLSGNMVSNEADTSTKDNHLVKVLIYNKDGI